MSRRSVLALATAIVFVVLVGYPVVTLAGGPPGFPSRSECSHGPEAGKPVAVVYGRFDEAGRAAAVLRRALAVGFKGTALEIDACGQWVVLLHNVPSVAVGDGIVKEAHPVGLSPKLELDPSS